MVCSVVAKWGCAIRVHALRSAAVPTVGYSAVPRASLDASRRESQMSQDHTTQTQAILIARVNCVSCNPDRDTRRGRGSATHSPPAPRKSGAVRRPGGPRVEHRTAAGELC
eukprot:2536093-Prymnesium_polylepis.1